MDVSLFSTPINLFWSLLIALALGLIIGIERGWSQRHRSEGSRIAGIRTFALTGLYGGLCAALAKDFSSWLLGFGLIPLIIILAVAFSIRHKESNTVSITGIVGLLITYTLGALAVSGEPVIASAAAVIVALILDGKPELHSALHKLEEYELDAGLRLLLISIVLLPILPDEGYGPWNAINPYEIWWLVVLIASISFLGYFAIRIGGARRGIMFTSVFAGLSSSTALTIQFSNLSREQRSLCPLLASGILFSCGTMFPRILMVLLVINAPLTYQLWPSMLIMMVGFYLPALWIWLKYSDGETNSIKTQRNPLALSSAVFFGFVLMLVMLLSQALTEWFGDTGTLLLSAIAGLTDVDPITLTLGRQTPKSIDVEIALAGIFIAATVNSLVKMLIVIFAGDRSLSIRTAPAMLGAILLGALTIYATHLA
ncbi:MgtC/SapB family protein [Neptuniibacter sp. QD34_54]|uniref:MgtC/SapB family protein n=1 Tax=unclassified Neptuniibacter TaxID=2630693 RepID=UPI0039F66FB1